MLEQPMSRRKFLKLALVAGMSGAFGAGYARTVEPAWVDVEQVRVTMRRLAPAFHGYRVAQISDLHMGDWMDRARLAEVVALVNRQEADLIAITGDFVTGLARRVAADLVAGLRGLRAPDGVVAVLGNHDHWANTAVMQQVLRDSGIRELRNTVHTLERDGALFHIAGVDDVHVGRHRLDRVLARLPAAGAALLLAHEPDFADEAAATGRFDLQISGHSHGGQVSLPFFGPFHLPELGRKYPRGRYQVGAMTLYTNRGIGMVKIHLRFNCRPELTVFTLESQPA